VQQVRQTLRNTLPNVRGKRRGVPSLQGKEGEQIGILFLFPHFRRRIVIPFGRQLRGLQIGKMLDVPRVS